jgi:hypothetical protein
MIREAIVNVDHDLGGQRWTVRNAVVQPVRHVNQAASGGSFVAIFTLKVEPDRGQDQILFVNELDVQDAAQHYVPAILRGVHEFAEHRARCLRPIAGVRVSLSDVSLHPVDSKEWAFQRATVLGLREAFKKAGVPFDCSVDPSVSSAGHAKSQDALMQALGSAMTAKIDECYGKYFRGQWDYGDEYLIPELCRRASASGVTQFWCAGTVTPEWASDMIALAERLGHWVVPDELGTGYAPFVPFPVPKHYADTIETHQFSHRLPRRQSP